MDVNVVPMDVERVLSHQAVVVRDGRIIAVGPVAEVNIPRGSRRIDGRGKYLMPGLADMHMHLGIGGLSNAERTLFLFLANGVTTVRNMDYFRKGAAVPWLFGTDTLRYGGMIGGDDLLRLKAQTASGALLGPRIYTASAWRLDSTKSIRENVAAYKAAGFDFIKPYMESVATLDSLAPVARELGVPLAGHADEDSLQRTLDRGQRSIEHLMGYPNPIGPGAPGWRSPADSLKLRALVAATVRAGAWNCPCHPAYALPGTEPSRWEQRYGLAEFRHFFRVEPDTFLLGLMAIPARSPSGDQAVQVARFDRVVKALHDGGAGLLLGTDAPAPYMIPGFSTHRALQAFTRAGLTPYEALATGTRNVAQYLGTSDSTGTIAAGKRADLVLLDANPLEDIRHTSAIAGVMVGGRWLSRAEIERRLDIYYHDDLPKGH